MPLIGARITLRPNPYYWDAAHVQLKSVVYFNIPDRAQAVLMATERGWI